MVSADKMPPVEAVKEGHTEEDGDSEGAPPSRDNPTVAQGKGTVVALIGWVAPSGRCCLVSPRGRQMSPMSAVLPCASLPLLSPQTCRSSPRCRRQKGCATAIPAAADTCGTGPGKAGASAASTATSSSKRGKGRGVCALQSRIHPSALPPCPAPRAPARDVIASG